MDVYEAIENRRTIRIYKAGASEEQLLKIILAGTKAPSPANHQFWEFIIIEDQHIIDQLAELKYQQHRWLPPLKGETQEDVERKAMDRKRSFENASVVAICHKTGDESGVWTCIENMSLAAVADGLGTGIVSLWGYHKEVAERILNVPAGHELTCVLKVGVPGKEGFPRDQNPFAPRRPDFSWLHRNKF